MAKLRIVFLWTGLACFGWWGAAPLAGKEPAAEVNAAASRARIAEDLRFLSSDSMRGRNTGSPEIERAAEYIGDRFAELGLNTDLYDGTPFQRFTAFREVSMGNVEENRLTLRLGDDEPLTLQLNEQFRPLALGGSGQVSAPLVFVGYGITTDDGSYDDYAGVDAEGKIVVMLRGEPSGGQEGSPFGGRRSSRYAYFSTKIENAIAHEAAGVLLVNHAEGTEQIVRSAERSLQRQRDALAEVQTSLAELPAEADNVRAQLRERKELAESQIAALEAELESAPQGLLDFQQAGRSQGDDTIPVAALGRQTYAELLRRAGKFDAEDPLAALEKQIEETLAPVSFAFEASDAELRTSLVDRDVVGINVIGELPGKGPLAEETVVIGSHYDHVGMGGPGSLAPGTIAVHNGADDNGSGTVMMMELARRLSEADWKNHRRIVFMAFSGEEKGLLGSKHYAREPRFALEQTVGMINLDMVGRLNEQEMLTVFGTGTATSFDGLVDQWTEKFGLPVRKDPSGIGPSDHTSFYEKQIPVLFFFTGLHSDYHRPSDDFEKINLDGMVRITDMVCAAASHLATVPQRPEYQKTGRGYGVRAKAYLGVAMRDQEGRVVITEVSPESPAAKAELRPGDEILKLGKTEPKQPSDVQDVIGGTRPGRKLPITISRGGDQLTITVELGVRP